MAYSRYISIGGKVKKTAKECSFTWTREHGCSTASIRLYGIAFDEFDGIEVGDHIDIRHGTSSSTRWWSGVVEDMRSRLDGFLEIEGVGKYTYLTEVFPNGRFGREVDTEQVSDLASSSASTGGVLASGTYTYTVSSLDSEGETLAVEEGTEQTVAGEESTVTVTWSRAQNATGYRIYRYDGAEYVYWDTSEITFVDDGSDEGTSAASLPAENTATTATIEDTDVQSVVKHLLDTWLSSELTYSAGQITAGADSELDDYNLMQSSASLYDVLRTLALKVGNVVFGVDEDDTVFFKPVGTSVVETYRIGEEYGDNGKVSSCTRRVARSGITAVKVEGEEEAEDPATNMGPTQVANNPELYTNPLPVTYSDVAPFGYGGARWGRILSLQIDVPAGIEIYGSIMNFPTIYPTTVDFFKTGGELKSEEDMKNWFFFIKGLYNIWREMHTDWKWSNTEIASVLIHLNGQISCLKASLSRTSFAESYELGGTYPGLNGQKRRRVGILSAPGVTTAATAQQISAHYLAEFVPTPDMWSINLVGASELIKPGIGPIRLITQKGKRYSLEVRSVSYSFDEAVRLSISAGDREYTEREEKEESKRAVTNLSVRPLQQQVWVPYTPSS